MRKSEKMDAIQKWITKIEIGDFTDFDFKNFSNLNASINVSNSFL